MIWYDLIWFDLIWYDMICYDDSDDYLTSTGTLLFWLVVTGTWFLDFPIQLGISWSQLTTSYFSEGLVYHQAASCIPVDPPKSRRIFFRTNMANIYKWIDMIDGAGWFFEQKPVLFFFCTSCGCCFYNSWSSFSQRWMVTQSWPHIQTMETSNSDLQRPGRSLP